MLKMAKDLKVQRGRPNFAARGNKVHFISLGCPRNRVDTEVMLGLLLKAGYEAVPVLQEADYIVVNTCGFLQAARDESVSTIGEAVKERKTGAKVIATGCMVQTHSDEIKKAHPSVDYFLGSGDVEAILKAVEAEEQGEQISSARSYLEVGEVPRKVSTSSSFAYLKIAEGCRKRCAYCIIPDIKGPLKSKPVERVVKEFNALLEQGVKEVILIAQDLGDWGKDLGFRKTDGLIHLLKELLKDPRPFWLRLLYLYPDEISDELMDLIKSDPRICRYLDMPIQHVNNTVLKAMRRATCKEDIIRTITELRRKIPEISIRTSLIVGFPGETEEQFEELTEFLRAYPLDNVGIFEYSQEPGSHAATLPDQIPEEVKRARQQKLAHIQQDQVVAMSEKLIGKKVAVLIEGYHPESKLLMVGRHQGQCPEIDGQVIINDHQAVDAFGTWYEVEITGLAGYDLIGRALNKM
ncbi:MAG: 30S ribosomal protein S12 methylthiotransferase RimO [Chlamydiia bacterium]|nr:30S ribosomal protein S12 methylthiotransferase RimO [Chlamydiia bacterium]